MATKYFSIFGDIEGNQWRINIIDDQYGGSSPFEFIVGRGFSLSYKGDVNDPFQAVIPSSVTFSFLIENSNHEWLFDQLASSEEGRFTIQIIDPDEQVFWNGTIIADQITIDDLAYPQRAEISATDDLGVLRDIPFKSGSIGYGGRAALNSHLWQAFSKVRWWGNADYNADMIRWANNIAAAEIISSAIDQISNLSLHHQVWYDIEDGSVVGFASAYEVLEDLAKAFNARIFQHQGVFHFVPVGIYSEFTTGSGEADFFSVDGYGNVSGTPEAMDLEVSDGSDIVRLRGNSLSYLPPFRRVQKKWNSRGDLVSIFARQFLHPENEFQSEFIAVDDGGAYYAQGDEIKIGYVAKFAPELDASVVPEAVPFLKLRIKVGTLYCTNSISQVGATFEISAGSWGSSSGYYYAPLRFVYYPFVNLSVNQQINGLYTFTNEITLPPLPSDQDTLEILPEFIGYEDDYSTPVTNFSSASAYASLRFSAWKDQGSVSSSSSLEYYAETSESSGEQIYDQEGRIGSSGNAGTFGQILQNAAGDAEPIGLFKSLSNPSIGDGNILSVGSQEILSIIRFPLRIRAGDVKGRFISPIHWLSIQGDGFLILDCSFNAYDRISSFEAFKIEKDLSDIVAPADPGGATPFDPGDDYEPSQDDAVKFLTDEVEIIDGNVGTLQSKVSTLETDVDQAEADITTLESGLILTQNKLDLIYQTFSPKGDDFGTTTIKYEKEKLNGMQMGLSANSTSLQSGSGNTSINLSENSPGIFEITLQDDDTPASSSSAIYAIGSRTGNRIGINKQNPSVEFDLNGRMSVSGSAAFAGLLEALNISIGEKLSFATDQELTPTNGEIVFDGDRLSFLLGIGSGVVDLADDWWIARNNSGSTIPIGTPVYVTGTIGASGRKTIAPMIADGSIEGYLFLGVAGHTIANDADGLIIDRGTIRGFNTSTLSGVLYVSDSVAGGWTMTKPSSPSLAISAAFVINSASNGTIAVRNLGAEAIASGGGGDAFGIIAIPGSSDIVAGSAEDTLNILEGSNIEMATNPATNSMTIAVASSPSFSGLTLTGVMLTTSSISAFGNIGTNGSMTAASGNIGNDFNVQGTFTANGAILGSGGIKFTGGGTSLIGIADGLPNQPQDLEIRSNGNVQIKLDYDDDETGQAFQVLAGDGSVLLSVSEDGITSGIFVSETPTIATISDFESTQDLTITITNYDPDATYLIKAFDSSDTETGIVPVDNEDGTWTLSGFDVGTDFYIQATSLEFGKLISAPGNSNAFDVTPAALQQRYWRLVLTDASKNPTSLHGCIGDIALYTGSGQTGTKYPTSAMTSNNTPAPFVVSSGYYYGSYYDWEAFDNVSGPGSMWWTISGATTSNNWIQIDLGSSIIINSIRISTYGSYMNANYAVLYGSNTGAFAGEEREMAFFQNIDGANGTWIEYNEEIS